MPTPPSLDDPIQDVVTNTVKEEVEDVAVAKPSTDDDDAPGSPAPPELPAPVVKQGLAKADYELMTKIVKYLTEYKNEEYVLLSCSYDVIA